MSKINAIAEYFTPTNFYDYKIKQSLRFEDGDSARLERTPTTAGDRQKFSFSCWVKRCEIGTGGSNRNTMFSSDDSDASSANAGLVFKFQDDKLTFISAGGTKANVQSNAVFRDPSAWSNVMVAVDTTQATAADRISLYVNGDEITSFASSTYPSQNQNYDINTTSNQIRIGTEEDTGTKTNFADMYMSEVHFIDGQALDPTDFGETKNDIWVAKKYTGTYGTNGFYLDFADGSALGDDESGNTNDFTSSGLASTDVVIDSPTNNFATMNPADKNDGSYAEGNLKATTGTVGGSTQRASYYVSSGKWYYEFQPTSNGGITAVGFESLSGGTYSSHMYHSDNGQYYNGSSASSYGATYGNSDIIGIALDADNQTVEFFKNGVSQGELSSSNSGMTAGDEYVPFLSDRNVSQTMTGIFNFGQDSSFAGTKTAQGNTDNNGIGDFYYSVPSGFLALCSDNLPEPSISPLHGEKPADYFNTVLWTGDGSNSDRVISGVGFDPDWVWVKRRSNSGSHFVTDVVRGDSKMLATNVADAEDLNSPNGYVSLNQTDGFELTAGSNTNGNFNTNNYTHVAWNWLAGGTAVSNTDGSITSSVSANTKAGLSVLTYTGTGSNGTVGHGLDIAPNVIITKDRTDPANWAVYHSSVGTGKYLQLNSSAATVTNSVIFNAVTDTTFSVGVQGDGSITNTNGDSYVSYCFHDIEGYSKFGFMDGNNSADGPFVYCGFRPAWIMTKQIDGSGGAWFILDVKRNTYNVMDNILDADTNGAERTADIWDVTSNGMKLRIALAGDFVFLAFAEQPFKYANAR